MEVEHARNIARQVEEKREEEELTGSQWTSTRWSDLRHEERSRNPFTLLGEPRSHFPKNISEWQFVNSVSVSVGIVSADFLFEALQKNKCYRRDGDSKRTAKE